MAKFIVDVTQTVEVELDEAKFDETFMEEFRASFYQFDDIQEHAEHIGQLTARGIIEIGDYSPEFIEGYGLSGVMGIKAKVTDTHIDACRVRETA